ncbi:MAG: molybdenum cofactor guanylyltransferase MobA [Burkholderiaceae bacterium]|nr:molybdenum cofactor guanylyltransferase MobA [Burkholderiaceae bacterium]
MPDKQHITGLILAGGRGARMGNLDKGLQTLDGEPLIAHVIRRLTPQVGQLLLNANRNLETYRQFGLPVISDELTGFEGPLAGLQTGMRHCPIPYLLTAPCDGPFLPVDLAAKLANALDRENADVAVAVTGQDDNRRTQPVYCLLKIELLPQLESYLASGKRKIDGWYAPLKVAEVLFDDEAAFRNINTLDELNQSSHG